MDSEKPVCDAVEAAMRSVKELDAAGAIAFIACESARGSPPQVVAKFEHIQDAHAYHRALIQCGEAARLIEAAEPRLTGGRDA